MILENRKTSPCSPCAPNLLHVLVSWIPRYHNLCSPDYRCRTIILTLCIEQYLVLRNLGRSYIFNKFPNFFNIIGIPPNCLMFVPDQWHFFKIQFHLWTFCWFSRLFRKTNSPLDFLLVFPPFWTANGVGAAAYPPPATGLMK